MLNLFKKKYRKEYGWVTGVELKSEKVLSAELSEEDLQNINDAVRQYLTGAQNKSNSMASIVGFSYFNATINTLHLQGRYDLSRLIYTEIEEHLIN